MIQLEELKQKARLKGISMGNAEKDYLLDILLLSISKNTKDELVFKGGTCLSKFYGLDRFSEDADFTAVKHIDVENLIKKIIDDMKAFGIDSAVIRKKEPFNSILTTFRCKGPLFNGAPQSFSSVRMDINTKSTIDIEPALKTYSSVYHDIPAFSMLVMQEKEIMAEKIRAISTRDKARDVYDLWKLILSGVKIDNDIISKKLDYYKTEFNYKEFEEALQRKSKVWKIELNPLLKTVPDFGTVKKVILAEAKKWRAKKKNRK